MIKTIVLIIVFFFGVAGCASTSPVDYSSLAVSSGAKIVPAVIKNPAPVCESDLSFARLDKPVDLQVYVDVKGEGTVCKSSRY